MKNKLVDVLYKITIGVFVLAVLISFVFITVDKNLSIEFFIKGIGAVLIVPGMFLSPFIIFITIIDRIFFHKFNTKNLYKTIVINMVYISISLYMLPNSFNLMV